jgi:hypothetical protein
MDSKEDDFEGQFIRKLLHSEQQHHDQGEC